MLEQKAATTVKMERPAKHVALVTLDRPEARNAVNHEVAGALDRIVAETEADPDIWVVVLTGAGDKAFCAGADLKQVSAGGMEKLFTPRGGFAGFVDAPRTKVWIAAVEGVALAGGFEIALACDLIVAATNAGFGLPEVKRGLLAAAGGAYRLPRMLPRGLAYEMLATGDRVDAKRAHDLGLVSRLATPGGSVEVAIAFAADICANAPLAVRESLAIARASADLVEADLRVASHAAQARLALSDDFHEGPLAFIEKRAPRWSGR
jgi:enoyl-CoA hydratase